MEENRECLKTLAAKEPIKARGTFSDRPSKVSSIQTQSDVDTKLAKTIARKLKVPFVNPMRTKVEPAAVAMLEPEMAFRRQAVPIRLIDETLVVAMLEPDQPVAIKSIEILTGLKVQPAAAPKNALSAALKKYYGNGKNAVPEAKSLRLQPVKDAAPEAESLRLPPVKDAVPKTESLRLQPVKAASVNASPEDAKSSFNISVISNKGGVGKTHLSINLAYALAETGAKVLLIDADLGNADISNKLGIFPKYHLMDFLGKKKQLQDLIVPTDFRFDLIAGSYGEFKLANLYHAQKVKFINHFKKISKKYDFALFDLGAGVSRTVMDFALAADRTVIVTTPQDLISGYACAKAAFFRFKDIEERFMEKLKDYEPQWSFSPMVVANQVNDLRQGFKLHETFKKAVEKNINAMEDRFRVELEYLGFVPDDRRSMRTAERKKKPLLLDSPHVKASQSIQHMATRFCNRGTAYDPRMKFKNPLMRFAAILSQKK
jgi:flagellar biosynthesis protein FlhG